MKQKISSQYTLDEYFSSGYEESENPFIKENSRKWGKYIPLVGSIAALLFLICAYISKFFIKEFEYFFLVVVYFLVGTPALISSLQNLKKLNINIQVLMTTAAFLSVLIQSELEGGLLLVLFSLSEAMEETVSKKTKGALHALHKIVPTMAYVIDNDNYIYPVSIREITLNTKILVKAGEIVPLDGIIIDGGSYINLSHLTGESIPVAKKIGDEVQAGSLNTDGTLTVLVTKTSGESTLTKIIKLITQAHEAKPKIQKILDKFGNTYATTIILLAIFLGIFLPIIFQKMTYIGNDGSVYRALAFLIAASPCALIIATPTAYLSAISSCAKRGVLLKGGIVLDALSKCQIVSFDKTGTLTTGKLSCSIIDIDGSDVSLEDGLSIAAGLERAVVHPIADAILRHTENKKITYKPIENLKVIAGCGVEGYVAIDEVQTYVAIGSVEFILGKIKDQSREKKIDKMLKKTGHVITLLIIKNTVIAFHFLDEIREQATNAVKDIQKNIKVVMLTGDNKENAQFVADKLNIKEIYANLKPEDKLRIVMQLAEKYPLAMVGDGINDAPALTTAMVGIAMGEIGSATAIEAADVVLLRDDISIINWLFKKSKKTINIVRQNLFLAIVVILFNSIFSILGFIPIWLAVILHEGSTIAVGFNSTRLLRK